MKTLLSFLIFLFFMNGCSMKLPPNEWQIQSSTAFESYTKNFLSDKDALANSDLKRSIEHAKSSADLSSLARVYLGACALNKAVGIDDDCEQYKAIEELIDDASLKSYYALLQMRYQDVDVNLLPKAYKGFYTVIEAEEYSKGFNELLNAPLSSQLIANALIKEHLHEAQIEQLIANASHYGYRKAVLFWLNHLEKTTLDKEKKEIVRKKIVILTKK
jgi:hypothetical protein